MEAAKPRRMRTPFRLGQDQAPPSSSAAAPSKKPIPPEQTNAENFYYMKQMQSKTPMVIELKDGEKLHGVIEWYDKSCLKFNRIGAPNLLVYKHHIKYMYKDEEADKP